MINQFILTFFFIGHIKKAPGSFGSLAAIIFWIAINEIFTFFFDIKYNNIFWIVFVIIFFIYGSFFIKNYAKIIGEIDHKSIVLDEVVAQIIVIEFAFYFLSLDKLIFNYEYFITLLISFILFRLFDIFKPYPINKIDQKIKNSFGVMLDDILAAIFSIIIIFLLGHNDIIW